MHTGNNENGEHEEADVVIIGGGPTGLFAGLLLHRPGISVRVLDAKARSLELGRADALNARTQQYFEVTNLLDEMLPQGLKCNTSSTYCNGEFTSQQSHWWTEIEHALHKNFLMIGQPMIEAIMSRELRGFISYNKQVASIAEDCKGVTVTTRDGSTVRSKYAFGADGARSTVRPALGITFTGTKPEMVWAVLDTFIETDFPICPEIITFQLRGQSRVSWIPRERGLSRFYVLLDGEVTQERAQQFIKEHLAPHRIEFKATEWYSTFDVKERIASSFISEGGRVLLGGDAAHVHSVNGGQGLNTGISDAFAVAWRLQMMFNKEIGPESARNLLQSYNIERRSTAAGVIQVAHSLVRDTRNEAKEYVSTIERTAAYITGMGISYVGLSSPLVQESEHGIWRAGYRCPDILLEDSTGKERWLYEIVSYGKFLILCIGEHYTGVASHQDIVTVYDILPSLRETDEPAIHPDNLEDDDHHIFRAKEIEQEQSFVVAVRPDMYVGMVGRTPEDVDGWFKSSIVVPN